MQSSKNKIAVVAFGGNALHPENQTGTVEEQQANADKACLEILELARWGYEVILVHGNGPQVGNVLLQSEKAADTVPALPLETCVACTQGTIGLMLTTAFRKACQKQDIKKKAATLLTTVIVDAEDNAFRNPTKPIGPFYSKEAAEQLTKTKGWKLVEDSGRGYRRVVPSPQPKTILEKSIIQEMVDSGTIVVAGGGGGIPVVESDGQYKGVEAVIDKDLTSALLAQEINADLYVILTGVPQVAINFGKPDMQFLDRITVEEARKYMAEGHFPPGSMGPKISAASKFIENGGKEVLITSVEHLKSALEHRGGTYIVR